MTKWRRNAMIGLAIAAVAAGITLAVTSGGGHHARRQLRTAGGQGDLIAAARYLGTPPQRLRSELAEGKTMSELARRTPGKSAAGVIDAIVAAKAAKLRRGAATGERLQRIRARASIEVEQPYAALAQQTGVLGVAAKYLGRTVPELRRERQAGRSLAQLADATPGRSSAELTKTLVRARRQAIRRAFARGALSAEAQRRLLSGVERRVRAAVSQSR